MRYTIKDVSRSVGLSVPQVRRRIDAIQSELTGHLHRGSRGAILLSESGLSLLRRAVDLEKERGLTCQDAVRVVKEETRGADQASGNEVVNVREGALIAELRDRLRELQEDRDQWRTLALRLQLPAPRRRWWARLLSP